MVLAAARRRGCKAEVQLVELGQCRAVQLLLQRV